MNRSNFKWFALIAVAVVSAVVGVDYYRWMSAQLPSPATNAQPAVATSAPTPAPAPSPKPKPKPKPTPVSTSKPTPAPVSAPASAPAPVPVPAQTDYSGNWSGDFVSTSPSQCAGFSGTWTMVLLDTNGVLTGTFSATDGTSGNVSGSVSNGHFSFDVVDAGAKKATIGWNVTNMQASGTFTRVSECASGSGPVSGTIGGSKN